MEDNRRRRTAVESLLRMHEHIAAHLVVQAIQAKREKEHLKSQLPQSQGMADASSHKKGRLSRA